MSIHIAGTIPVGRPAFTDDPTENRDGYYYATIDQLRRPTDLKINFDEKARNNLDKGSYISSEDTSDESFCFYLHLPERQIQSNLTLPARKIQLKSVIIQGIDEIEFFHTLFWEILNRILNNNKECKTHCFIYKTEFYDYVHNFKDLSKEGHLEDIIPTIDKHGHLKDYNINPYNLQNYLTSDKNIFYVFRK